MSPHRDIADLASAAWFEFRAGHRTNAKSEFRTGHRTNAWKRRAAKKRIRRHIAEIHAILQRLRNDPGGDVIRYDTKSIDRMLLEMSRDIEHLVGEFI